MAIILSSLNPKEITQELRLKHPFIGDQIFSWVQKKLTLDFSSMTNLSKDLRAALPTLASISSTQVTDTKQDPDGTTKLQIKTLDENKIECVLLSDIASRRTACLSTQAGCAMGCAFCRTGTLGLARNLTSSEIVEQFHHLSRFSLTKNYTATNETPPPARAIDNIVFMGMGEPLANFPAVKKAIEILGDSKGQGISPRRITISTCGLCRGIIDLTDALPKVGLAVSLVTADDDIRSSLMKVNKANPLKDLKDALKYYITKTSNRVTLEAVLLDGINTDPLLAKKIIDFSRDITNEDLTLVNINLIPYNINAALPFRTPSGATIRAFSTVLKSGGLNVTVRFSRGRGVSGACGQLGEVNVKNAL